MGQRHGGLPVQDDPRGKRRKQELSLKETENHTDKMGRIGKA
jgi:hypothetical protein